MLQLLNLNFSLFAFLAITVSLADVLEYFRLILCQMCVLDKYAHQGNCCPTCGRLFGLKSLRVVLYELHQGFVTRLIWTEGGALNTDKIGARSWI